MPRKIKIKTLKSGELSEESIHKLTLLHVEEHPLLSRYKQLILHFPNEGKRSQRYGALMKSLGMRKGASDLFIAVPRHGFGGAWIELKSVGGILSSEQKKFLSDMKEQNYFTAVCWSIKESIDVVEWYLIDANNN
jgi:hypothetical protein